MNFDDINKIYEENLFRITYKIKTSEKIRANEILKTRIEIFFKSLLPSLDILESCVRYLYFDKGELILIPEPYESAVDLFENEYKFIDDLGKIHLIRKVEVIIQMNVTNN